MADRAASRRGCLEADPRRVRRGDADLAAAAAAGKGKEPISHGDGEDVDATAIVSAQALQMGPAKFMSMFYKTLNEHPSTLYKLYDRDAVLVWTFHNKAFCSSEIKTRKAIKWYLGDGLGPTAKFNPHCFVAQQQGDVVLLVVNGNCQGFGRQSNNYVQSFLLTNRCIILSDVLLIFKDDKPIRVPKYALRPVPLAIVNSDHHSNIMRGQSTRILEQSSRFTGPKETEPERAVREDNTSLIAARTRKRSDGKTVAIVYDERMLLHTPDFYCMDDDVRMIRQKDPSSTVEIPERISAIMQKLYDDKLMQRVTLVKPSFATVEDIVGVHGAEYAEFINCLPPSPTDLDKFMFFNTDDMFCSAGTRDAVYLAAGAAIKAAQLVISGEFEKAFAVVRPPGHHAGKDEAEGYCYVNNLAIAALNLLRKNKAKRVLGVDWDVHHGNGTQELLYSSNEVLFFSSFNNSLHYPKTMKQGVEHIGKGKGAGYNVNVPLRNNFGNVDMLYIWEELLLPLIKEFNPDIILVSCGYDAAEGDVGGAQVTPPCFATLLHKLIESGNGKVVLILEGGYELPILANCASHCVRLMTGDKDVLLKEEKQLVPPRSTRETVKLLKHHLSRYWEVFKDC